MSTAGETNDALAEAGSDLEGDGGGAAKTGGLRARLAEEREPAETVTAETVAAQAVEAPAPEPPYEEPPAEAVEAPHTDSTDPFEPSSKKGGVNPFAVIVIAFLIGLLIARMLVWIGRARA